MKAERRSWPTPQEALERRRGLLDDRTALTPPYDMEDWEICGEPEPPKAGSAHGRRDKDSKPVI